ncbi:exosortase A [Hyphococcus formosus]|uniref:exosortase A n=1 Tax=Hyphococcus formosus TaxID=3143534 RepID=UPI00398B5DC6
MNDTLKHKGRHQWVAPVATFGVFVALCVIALHPTAYDMVRQWIFSSTYHHGVIVAPLAIWMIMQRPLPTPNTHLPSLAIIIVASLGWLVGRAAGISLVEQLALIGMLIGGVAVIFGTTAFRQWAFPLAFLFFMVPFGETIIPPLQDLTANVVVSLLSLFGFDVSIDGVLIRTSSGLFEIAEACSGLNFLLAALMISSLYAYLSLRDFRMRLAFVVIAAIISLIANFIRVFLLIWIATITDMRIAVGPDHLIMGLIFYGLVFLALFYVGERMRLRAPQIVADAPLVMHDQWKASVATTTLLPIIAISLYATFLHNQTTRDEIAFSAVPLEADGWYQRSAPENWSPVFANPDFEIGRTYEKASDAVYVNLAIFSHDRPGAEIVTSGHRSWDDAEWHRVNSENEVIYLFGQSSHTDIDIVAGTQGRRLAVAKAYWRGSNVYTDRKAFKIEQTRDKLQGKNPPGGVIMIAATFIDDPQEAIRKIRAFTGDLESLRDWQTRNGLEY